MLNAEINTWHFDFAPSCHLVILAWELSTHVNTKQDGRLPPAYFAPSQFGKDAILKDENDKKKWLKKFLEKNTLSSSYFLIFSTLKVFSFFAKKAS